MADATSYIYAGSAHITTNSGTQRGGLFRRAVGDDHWQALANGLPEEAEVRAIAVHPQNPQVDLCRHAARTVSQHRWW